MSRRRQLKKEQRQREELAERLAELHRLGADRAFLDLARGRSGEIADGPAAALYGEVVDRALARALAAGDLAEVEDLLGRLARDAQSRPWARLAEAVALLDAGRFAEAQDRLGALVSPDTTASAAAGRPLPPGLPAALLAFAREAAAGAALGGAAEPARRVVAELAALTGRGFAAGPEEIGELRRAVRALAPGLGGDAAAHKLSATALAGLDLLGELGEIRRAPEILEPEPLKSLARRLFDLFRAPTPPLLAPLHHALRLGWRELLAALLARREAALAAALGRLPPALLELDLEGGGDGLERLRTASTLTELAAGGRHRELALRLAAESRSEKAPERLAVLWSLELLAWERADEADEEGEGPDGDPMAHAAAVRLGSMAAAIPQAIPEAQRREVARYLAGRLLDCLGGVAYCSHVADTAAALLGTLPDDPALLAIAFAAAVVTGDSRGEARLAAHLAARPPARPEESGSLLRLVGGVMAEEPEDAVRILGALRPLAGEAGWPALVTRAVRGLVIDVCDEIVDASLAGLGASASDFTYILNDLALYRPLFGDRAELEALEVAVGGLGRRASGTAALPAFFARQPELEPALVVLRVLVAALRGSRERPWLEAPLAEARAVVTGRLDSRWPLWRPWLSDLLFSAGHTEIERIESRLQRLLAGGELEADDRDAIEHALERTVTLAKLTAPPAPRRKKRRRPDDRQADLF